MNQKLRDAPTKEELQRVMDNPNVNIICELGTWYGKSAEFF